MLASDAKTIPLKVDLVQDALPFYRLSTEAHNKTKHRLRLPGFGFKTSSDRRSRGHRKRLMGIQLLTSFLSPIGVFTASLRLP